MADLIAQGTDPLHRWRRKLPAEASLVLGRSAGNWSAPWDERISRTHAAIRWDGEKLQVSALEGATNPIFFRGRRSASFEMLPGEHFVIGGTTFTLADEHAQVSLAIPHPASMRTFSPEELAHVRYQKADERLEVLSRLPDIIASSGSDNELYVRLVNMLLSGIERANAVAVIQTKADDRASVSASVLHWDRRILSGNEFRPSERLIRQSLDEQASVVHLWSTAAARGVVDFTLSEGVDWAFCTPIPGIACQGCVLYVTGGFGASDPANPTPEILGDDIKFTELTAATLSGLREARLLARRQASLSHFFSPKVLEALAGQDPEQVLTPREADVTVLFCDLRGFSRQSEKMAANLRELLDRVSGALGVMTRHILEQGGVVGDFHGDAAMGFWGWPLPQADAAQRACQAALAIRREFATAAVSPLADFRAGIGIASGRAVAGKIGTVDQVKVTVFGPVVNLASRLEGLTKVVHAPILMDPITVQVLKSSADNSKFRMRRVARICPPGLVKPVDVTELLPPLSESPHFTDEDIRHYESALEALENKDWQQAVQLLHLVSAQDEVKDFLTVFIAHHRRTPPENWDGTIRIDAL